eukprot:403365438
MRQNITDSLQKYAYAQVRQVEFTYTTVNGQLKYEQKENVYKLVKCDETRFKGEQVVTKNLGIREVFKCPEDLIFGLKGNFQSNFLKFLKIEVQKCTQDYLDIYYPGQECESQEDIDEIFKNLELFVPTMNNFFDANSYDEIIKTDLTNYYYTTSESNFSQSYLLKIGQNNAILKDSPIVKSLFNQNITFNTLKPYYNFNTHISGQFAPLVVIFILNEEVITLERQMYTVFDALATTGGFIGIINIACRFILSGLQKLLFYISIVSQFSETISKNSKQKQQILKKAKQNINSFQSKSTNKHKSLVEKLYSNLIKTKVEVIQFKEYIQRLIMILFCRRNKVEELAFKYKSFTEVKTKIDKYLEITNLIKAQNFTKIFGRLILKHDQISLMKGMINQNEKLSFKLDEKQEIQAFKKEQKLKKAIKSVLNRCNSDKQKDLLIINMIINNSSKKSKKIRSNNLNEASQVQIDTSIQKSDLKFQLINY